MHQTRKEKYFVKEASKLFIFIFKSNEIVKSPI